MSESVLRAFASPAAESTRWTQLQAVFYGPAPWPPPGPEDCGVAEGFPGAIRGPPDAACGPAVSSGPWGVAKGPDVSPGPWWEAGGVAVARGLWERYSPPPHP